MAILTKGQTFANADAVTSTKLNNLVDAAAFVAGASGTTDDSTLEVNGSGRLQVKDLGITGPKFANGTVTYAKIQNVANMRVLGNTSGSSAAPSEVSILDEDNMVSDSATAIPTQQSVKAYVDTTTALTPSTYAGGESVTLPNGLIMKFGIKSTPTGATDDEHTVTFGTAFPTGVLSITITPRNTSANKLDSVSAQVFGVPTTSAFTFLMESNAASDNAYWMAIGY